MNKWIYGASKKVSIYLLIFSAILLAIVFSPLGESFMSSETANTINNILIGMATSLIGIIVTVSFVQYTFDKQNEEQSKKDEIRTIKRYNKYMNTLILKYSMFYISVTTRLENRNNVDLDNAFHHKFKFNDMADMYMTSMYISEGFLTQAIVLFYRAEEKIREYMFKMLENIDFKYNTGLEEILLEFVTKSVDLDMRGSILNAMHTSMGAKKMSEVVSEYIADEKHDWLGMFDRNELKGNMMFPYVIFYYNIQDQARLLQNYLDYVKALG